MPGITDHGFFSDWIVDDKWDLCTTGGEGSRCGVSCADVFSGGEEIVENQSRRRRNGPCTEGTFAMRATLMRRIHPCRQQEGG